MLALQRYTALQLGIRMEASMKTIFAVFIGVLIAMCDIANARATDKGVSSCVYSLSLLNTVAYTAYNYLETKASNEALIPMDEVLTPNPDREVAYTSL
jgi:hypothetical protein